MEVGAVKQAFNNEVILLKKKLNQAKTQVIHKLIRKAKTLTEKKAPEHLKEKLKRKAESAINEVLITKKIKSRDIAKFIITHTGQVSDYLNKPKVDNDKACARLVLHKSLQDKYKFFRNRFGNIPIKDLFMSRQERRKLKKEAREQGKNKKKGKGGKVTNSVGDWDVEDVAIDDDRVSDNAIGSDQEINGDDSEHSEEEKNTRSDDENNTDQDDSENGVENASKSSIPQRHVAVQKINYDESIKSDESDDEMEIDSNNDDREDERDAQLIKHKPENEVQPVKPAQKSKSPKNNIDKIEIDFDAILARKPVKVKENKKEKKVKENKNKNLKEKLQNRKFKKDIDDDNLEEKRVIDPFFITATGENYLSLAEPRQPDEVKEVHKQGNRQERRAAMFGRYFKPKNNFKENNFRSNKFNEGYDGRSSGGRNNVKDFNDSNSKFNDKNSKFDNKNDRFNSKNVNNNRIDDKIEEKLHPSWEAKRKLKSISLLPSQGKKIVFDDN